MTDRSPGVQDVDCNVGGAPSLDTGGFQGYAIDEAATTWRDLCPDFRADTR